MEIDKKKITDADLDGFGFRVGYKSELDLKFRKAILDNIPEGKKLTVFIKEIVVEWAEGGHQGTSSNKEIPLEYQAKIQRLEAKLAQLENQIRSGKFAINQETAVVTEQEEPDEEIKAKIDNLMDLY